MRVVLFISFLFLASGCGFRIEKNQKSLLKENWFQQIQRVTLQPNCVKCHSGAMARKNIRLGTYSEVMSSEVVVSGAPEKSRLVLALRQTRGMAQMPPAGTIDEEQISAVENWIRAGAQEEAPLPSTVLPDLPVKEPGIVKPNLPSEPVEPPRDSDRKVTFRKLTERVLTPFCLGCHSGEEPSGGLNLSDYSMAMKTGAIVPKGPLLSRLYQRVVGDEDKMPLESPPLSAENIKLIYEWIQDGAQDN